VEVVSTNWQNDYARKSEDYALLGITEYWIVDYLGLGGRDYRNVSTILRHPIAGI
jgi:Uma2 family endonuclease